MKLWKLVNNVYLINKTERQHIRIGGTVLKPVFTACGFTLLVR